MKAHREHRVPLSARALAILDEMRRLAHGDNADAFVFRRWQAGQAAFQHGVPDAVAAHGAAAI